jgi:hypothetical protein
MIVDVLLLKASCHRIMFNNSLRDDIGATDTIGGKEAMLSI